ncbi:MAG TPA: LemA family protein [Stellaceae bacterium]|nr:LemA family protein [Stellaceae bacterium]
MSTTWIVVIVVLAVLGFLVMIYNRLVALRQAYKNAFADIDVQMKQRHDLVPNLVETVKGYAAHESGVLEKVTEARTAAMRAGSLQEKGQAESVLSAALGRVFAVAEAYPQLKANENFRQLQSELEEIENKIAAARRFYNNAVAEYNTSVQQFPAALIAGATGFTPAEMWALDATEKAAASEPPKVSFGG